VDVQAPSSPALGSDTRSDARTERDRLSDTSSGGGAVGTPPAPNFVWRPAVPRNTSVSAAARLRTAQQDQRERLLSRLFPHESQSDSPLTVGTPTLPSTPTLSTPPPELEIEPAASAFAAEDDTPIVDLADIDELAPTPADILAAGDLLLQEGGDEDIL